MHKVSKQTWNNGTSEEKLQIMVRMVNNYQGDVLFQHEIPVGSCLNTDYIYVLTDVTDIIDSKERFQVVDN